MYICKDNFHLADRDKPQYSHHEVDYYAWIPRGNHVSNHRLSLRKNLVTSKFEVYRRFYDRTVIITNEMVISTSDDTNIETVAFVGSFEESLAFANNEYNRFHDRSNPDNIDKPCKHTYPEKSLLCRM